jgi:hypothetical protein
MAIVGIPQVGVLGRCIPRFKIELAKDEVPLLCKGLADSTLTRIQNVIAR